MKSYVANGTGSQQTLTESQDNKIPVYDSMEDVTADLANLEENQIIATHDTGSELSAPVDTVQSGNMHAVTSNAVAESLKAENVYTDNNKIFVTKTGGVYIFNLQGCTLTQFKTAISELGITSQNPQLFGVSRRNSSNNQVFPATAVFVNGAVNAWYANGGVGTQLSATDIVYGQAVIYSE